MHIVTRLGYGPKSISVTVTLLFVTYVTAAGVNIYAFLLELNILVFFSIHQGSTPAYKELGNTPNVEVTCFSFYGVM